jgi:hypothetical protein
MALLNYWKVGDVLKPGNLLALSLLHVKEGSRAAKPACCLIKIRPVKGETAMFNSIFCGLLGKHNLFLTSGEDEAIRSSGQGGGGQGDAGNRPDDPETARGSGAAVEDTSAGVGLGEPTGNSSSAETGLGNMPGTGEQGNRDR